MCAHPRNSKEVDAHLVLESSVIVGRNHAAEQVGAKMQAGQAVKASLTGLRKGQRLNIGLDAFFQTDDLWNVSLSGRVSWALDR